LPDLEVAMNCFGLERLMIGSDWPVCTVAASYSRTMKVVSDFISGIQTRFARKSWAETQRDSGDWVRNPPLF